MKVDRINVKHAVRHLPNTGPLYDTRAYTAETDHITASSVRLASVTTPFSGDISWAYTK